jgi:hypothetical protein
MAYNNNIQHPGFVDPSDTKRVLQFDPELMLKMYNNATIQNQHYKFYASERI